MGLDTVELPARARSTVIGRFGRADESSRGTLSAMDATPSPLTGRSLLAGLLVAGVLVALPASAGAADPVLCQGVEATIVGTDGDDSGATLTGTDGDDVIHGLGGRDEIYGLGGNDLICGGGGGDTIEGGPGDDDIYGQGGHDTLKGGKGDDAIRAGHHNDRVWGNGGTDTIWGGMGSDTCIAESEANCELDTRWGHTPDEWLPLLDDYFGDIGQTANARIVLGCESLGEPFIVNPASGTTGLFQFRKTTWTWINPLTPGWEGEVRVHPEASIATARTLFEWAVTEQGYGWQPWTNCGCHPDVTGKPGECNYVADHRR